MTERELEQRLTARYRPNVDEAAPAELRTSVAGIPEAVGAPGLTIRGLQPTQRPLAFAAAILLLAAALAGGIAVGSGLLRLPWQSSTPIDPASIAPCELVSGGSAREIAVSDDGVPAIGAPNVVDYEEWINREGELEVFSAVGGRTCFFLLSPDPNNSRGMDSVLHLRGQATTGAEASDLAANIFDVGQAPFDQGPIIEQVGANRAWVGLLGERPSVSQPVGGQRMGEFFTPGMAVAVSAEPYFLVLTFDMDASILELSDAARGRWWERYWDTSLWPGIRTPLEDILTRLTQMESARGQ